jgi:hypothetical protein
MNKDGIFIFFTLLVLAVFIGITYYWLKTGSKEYNIDDTIKGLYKNSGLNQRCSATNTQTDNGVTILLPQYFEPQTCGYNLTCVYGDSGAAYGYCKSVIGGQCFSVYDCAPSNTGDIFCTGGVCTKGNTGVLFSSCGSSGTIGGGTICDAAAGLICTNTICLLSDGYPCTNSNQCSGGACVGSTGFPLNNGITGVCISRQPPAGVCTVDYCQAGFGCYISNDEGYCQPLDKTGPIPTGSKGAFCNIPLYSSNNNLTCDDGLICNFDASLMAPSVYPSLVGYGLCDLPIYPAASTCSSVSGACIPPNVCYAGECLAPKEGATGDSNINWCGYGSTTVCGNGYECDSTNYCRPSITDSLCGVTGSGICINGLNCSSNKLGIFTPIKTGNTGAGVLSNFGTWNYIDLPSGETTVPSDESFITSYQYTTIESNLPVTYTTIAYLPKNFDNFVLESPYFWFIRIKINEENNNVTIVNDWNKVDLINTSFYSRFDGIKFTSAGNLTFRTLLSVSPTNSSLIAYYTFDPINFNSNTFDVSTFDKYIDAATEVPPNSGNFVILYAVDWDVDDKFNLTGIAIAPSAAILTVSGSTTTVYYDTIPLNINQLSNNIPQNNNSATQTGTFVKYIYNYNNTPSIQNFIFNGTDVGDDLYKIYIPNNLSVQMDEPTCYGIASFATYINNIENMEMYYISDKGFRYFNSSFKNSVDNYSSIDVGIQGYAPTYTTNNGIHSFSYGNLDRRMFSLTTNCA